MNKPLRPLGILLTRMIFDYWLNRMSWPNDYFDSHKSNCDSQYSFCDREDLYWYDGYNAGFWYLLNVEWYRMNDKLFAFSGCKEPFDNYLRDFDVDYIRDLYY
jgi:hypothetical protein